MRKDIKIYPGICEACDRPSQYTQRDHRVPVRLGGEHHQANLQDLCLECHKRKTALECSLMLFYGETSTIKEWYQLAFQNGPKRIKQFVDHLVLRAHHFEEVQRSLEDGLKQREQR